MKILMLCLGNICRSPLAQGVLEEKVKKANLNWLVDSAGTGSWHVGEPPHKGSLKIAYQHGIDISQQRSRQITKQDFDHYDLILAMDSQNYQDALKLAQTDEHKAKVKIFLNYLFPNENRGVPDPYFTGDFQEVYDLIDQAASQIIDVHNP